MTTEQKIEPKQEQITVTINMLLDNYHELQKWAKWGSLADLYPDGDFSNFAEFCFQFTVQAMKQRILAERGYH